MISKISELTAAGESQVVTCDLGGEMALLHLERSAYYGLDAIGARIWQLLAQPSRLVDVRDQLVREYDVDPRQCEADLQNILSQMAAVGLIRIRDAEAL